jgi:protein-disulfide isomerase
MRFMKTIGIAVILAATTQCGRTQDGDATKPSPAATNDPAAPAATGEPARTKVAPAPVRLPIDGLPIVGSDRALVTIVEFTDYQCPYCARAEDRMTALRAAYGDDVRVAIAAHPLPMHERARPAALAAFAAAEQGKLAAMHARLFADTKALDDAGLVRAATDVGLDLAQFDASRRGPSAAAALDRSEALGRTAGVTGTPTFFINGRRVVGAQPLETFKQVIDEELAVARALVASGVRREDVYAKILASAGPLTAESPPSDDACGANKDGDCHGAPTNAAAPAADEPRVDVRIDGAPIRGFARAPVTVVVFADFECPFCTRIQPTLRDLESAYPGKVRIAFKHHPLPMHEHARMASKAALAAQAQGKFWEYQDALFAHQTALDRASLERYARDVGLDMTRFARDLDGTDLDARIAADETDARALGANGTPTVFVNGRRVTGAQPLAVFKAAVDRALAESP